MAIEAVEMNAAPRVVAPQAEPEDFDTEGSLRPKRLEEYIGQEKAKENLKIYLQAAQKSPGQQKNRLENRHTMQYNRILHIRTAQHAVSA